MSAASNTMPCELPTLVMVFTMRNTMFYERRRVNSFGARIYFWRISDEVWTKHAHSVTVRCPREGTTLCRAAKADATSLRPAIPARISFTRPGATMSFATHSTRSKASWQILDFRNSSSGYINSSTPRFSEVAAVGLAGQESTGSRSWLHASVVKVSWCREEPVARPTLPTEDLSKLLCLNPRFLDSGRRPSS